ncbi:MAG: chromate transporter [Pseudobutyrivibrio sp.]|nr:chromate transporter [Pseudobutyrivibrio sp.]
MLLTLFLLFAKIGLFTFGGGYAMISIIENICVEQKKWITHDEMMDVAVIAESTPGPIAINCATYVGYKQKGIVGAIVATLGVVFPSFVVIFAISMFLDNFLEITWIASAFKGIRIAVALLIIDAALKMVKQMSKKFVSIAIMVCSFIAMLLIDYFSWNFSSISMMLIAAIFSLSLFIIQNMIGKSNEIEE